MRSQMKTIGEGGSHRKDDKMQVEFLPFPTDLYAGKFAEMLIFSLNIRKKFGSTCFLLKNKLIKSKMFVIRLAYNNLKYPAFPYVSSVFLFSRFEVLFSKYLPSVPSKEISDVVQ